jgi:acetyltransferase-like isoleucine patch superfamily enzyme
VVTRDIPERTLAFGSPARPVRELDATEEVDEFTLFEWEDAPAPRPTP